MLHPDSRETREVKNSEEVLQADENAMIKGRQAPLDDCISQENERNQTNIHVQETAQRPFT